MQVFTFKHLHGIIIIVVAVRLPLRSSAGVDVSPLARQHLNDLNEAELVQLVTPALQALSSDWLTETTPTGLMCIS